MVVLVAGPSLTHSGPKLENLENDMWGSKTVCNEMIADQLKKLKSVSITVILNAINSEKLSRQRQSHN